jgi:hypothetical protein
MAMYTCLCCGYTEMFESADAAFQAGWDVAPYFTLQPLCNLCPAAPVALYGLDRARARHAEFHATWQRDGRPKEFDVNAEHAIDGASDAEIEREKVGLEAIMKLFRSKKH